LLSQFPVEFFQTKIVDCPKNSLESNARVEIGVGCLLPTQKVAGRGPKRSKIGFFDFG